MCLFCYLWLLSSVSLLYFNPDFRVIKWFMDSMVSLHFYLLQKETKPKTAEYAITSIKLNWIRCIHCSASITFVIKVGIHLSLFAPNSRPRLDPQYHMFTKLLSFHGVL